MSPIRLSDDRFLGLIDNLTALPWPMTEPEAVTRLEALGWRKWAKRDFSTGLPVAPDDGSVALYPEGTVALIEASVTDWSGDSSAERDLHQHQVFEHFAGLLAAKFGVDGTPFPFPRDHDAIYWELDNGAWIELRVSSSSGWVNLTSPDKAEVDRDLIRRGQYR